MKTRHDNMNGYCRMLGHMLPFRYCRSVNNGLPCRKILDCWYDRFSVQDFLTENYREDELKSVFTGYRGRLGTILEIIDRAKTDAVEDGTG